MAGTHFISSEHRDGTEPQPGVCSSGCDDSSTTAFCSSENKENWLLGKWAWEVGGGQRRKQRQETKVKTAVWLPTEAFRTNVLEVNPGTSLRGSLLNTWSSRSVNGPGVLTRSPE